MERLVKGILMITIERFETLSFLGRNYFGPWVYPMGFIVIALVQSVGLLVFKQLEGSSLVFFEILHEVIIK